MLANLIKKEQLVSASGSTDLLIHTHSVKVGNLILSSILTKANSVFLIAQSKDLPNNMICKANINNAKVLLTKLSPDMSSLACFLADSKICILSTVPFLNFVSPNTINGLVNTPMFSHSTLGYTLNPEKSTTGYRESPPFKFNVINAFWWHPIKRKYLIIIESNGVQIISTHTFSVVKSLQYSDVVTGSFAALDNGVGKIALFTKTNTHIITIQQQNEEITHTTTLEGILYDYSIPILTQMSELKDSKWLLTVLNQKLIFYDNDVQTIPITSFDTSSTKTTSFAVTKNFLYEVTDGIASVQFIKSIDVRKHELMRDVISITVVDAQNDIVLLLSPSSATIFSLRAEPKILFNEFLLRHQYRDAFALCDGFNLDMKSECEQAATKCIKSGDCDSALEVLREGKCEIRSALQRLLSEGKEKYALHLLLRSPSMLPKDKTDKIFENLLLKIYYKNQCFTRLNLLLKRIVSPSSILPTLISFNQTQLYKDLVDGKEIEGYPLALLARFTMENQIETTKYLEYASQLDLQEMPRIFSAEFKALMHSARKPDGCAELSSVPVCSTLKFTKNTNYYLHGRHLYSNGSMTDPLDDHNYLSFEIFGDRIFAIDDKFNVYSSPLSNIKFDPLDCPQTYMMQSDSKSIAFLSVNGSILKLGNGRFFETYDGDFVDICFYKGIMYGLDEHGVVFSFSDKSKKEVYSNKFINAIAASSNGIVYVSGQICIYNSEEIQLDFVPELVKSCENYSVVVGHGKAAIFGESVKIITYSERIGTILDITNDIHDNIVLIGSSSSPMLINQPQPDYNDFNFSECQLIVSKYPSDVSLKIVNHACRTMLLFLYGKYDEIENKYEEIAPFVLRMDSLNAIAAIHAIATNCSSFPDILLSSDVCRTSFLQHPQDLKVLKQNQLVKLLPPAIKQKGCSMDLVQSILKPPSSSSIISSSMARESDLIAFSCSHVMNQTELDSSLFTLKEFFETAKLKKSYQCIESNYKQNTIDLQCPRCLLRHLSQKYK